MCFFEILLNIEVNIKKTECSLQARTEITITPVVNTPAQSHSNDLIQMVILPSSFVLCYVTYVSSRKCMCSQPQMYILNQSNLIL